MRPARPCCADGGVVEHVESFLDPDHFSLQLTFGDFPA
jgi:hypothetical protein